MPNDHATNRAGPTSGPWVYQQGLLWRDTGKLMPEELVKLPDISGWADGALNEDPEALANARLIAAAPALYEALAGLVEAFANPYDSGQFEDGEAPALDRACAALAAARGEPQP